MRKTLTNLSKVALGLFCLYGTAVTAQAQEQATLGSEINLSEGQYVIFTPTSDGILTLTTTTFTFANPVYLQQNYDEQETPVTPTSGPDFGFETSSGGTWTYSVSSSDTYWIGFGLGMTTPFTLQFEAGNSGGSGSVSGLPELKMDYPYTGISASNPLKGYFTAPSMGTLTAAQTGSDETHFYTDENHTQLVPTSSIVGNSLKYELGSGETIYYFAPEPFGDGYSQYDNISGVTFSWEGSATTIPEIKDNVPFTSYNELRTYVPEKDGELTISLNSYVRPTWWNDGGSGLLFNNVALTDKVALSLQADGDNDGKGSMTAIVEGQKTYYFYNDVAGTQNIEFTFSLADMVDPALQIIEPEPGAIDAAGDFGGGVKVGFYPAEVKFEKVTLSYTTADGTQINKDLVFGPNNVEGEDYSWNGDNTYSFKAVSYAYAGFTPASGTWAANEGISWQPAKKGTPIVLTLVGANYNGVYVSENNTGVTNGIELGENGNITLTWTKPAVEPELVSSPSGITVYSTPSTANPDLVAKWTFNLDLSTTQIPSASYVFGNQTWAAGSSGDNPDPGDEIPASNVKVEGNTLTVDLNGINFGAKYAEGTKNYSQVTIFVGNLFTADGQKVQIANQNPGVKLVASYSQNSAPAPSYMSGEATNLSEEISLNDINAAVALSWPESVSLVSDTQNITIKANGQTYNLGAEFVNLVPSGAGEPGTATKAATGDEGQMMYLLLGASGLMKQIGPGAYEITIPEGYVMNASKAVNKAQTVNVTVADVATVAGTVNPENGKFEVGKEVSFSITFDGQTPVINDDAEDAPVVVMGNTTEFEASLNWNQGVIVEGNAVIINLGDALAADSYTATLREGAVKVGDAINADVEFTFTVGSDITTPGVLATPSVSPADGSQIVYGGITLNWGITEIKATSVEPLAYVSFDGGEEFSVDINVEYARIDTGEGYAQGPATTAIVDWNRYQYEYGGGEYTVRIPAGTFCAYEDAAVVNEELEYTYYIVSGYGNEVVIPAPEYGKVFNAAALSAVTVAWVDRTSFSKVNGGEILVAQEIDNGQVMALAADPIQAGPLAADLIKVNAENGTIVLDLSGLQPGTWTITIPEGYVNFNEFELNYELVLSYTVTSGLSSATVVAPNSSVLSIPVDVKLTWDYMTVTPTASGLKATLNYTDLDGEAQTEQLAASAFSFATIQAPGSAEGGPDQTPADTPVPAAETMSGNVLTIAVAEILENANGMVTLSIPAGIVTDINGAENPAQEVQFQIIPLYTGSYTVLYNDSENTLNISWEGASEIYLMSDAGKAVIEGEDESVIVLTPYSLENLDGRIDVVNGKTLEISLKDLDLEGNYTLYLPEGYVNIDSKAISGAVSYDFYFEDGVFGEGTTGVAALNQAVEEGGVYTLQGLKVKNTNNLQKGIYIINGKKVLIKK